MKNQMLFVIILCGLLNSSSFLASGKEQSTSILARFLRPPLATPPLSQRQLQQIQQQKQQAELEAIQKKAEEEAAAVERKATEVAALQKKATEDAARDRLLAYSKKNPSGDSILKFNELKSDGSLDGFKRPETTSSSKNELSFYPTKVDFSPKNNHPCQAIQELTRKNTDTFVMKTYQPLPYLLPEHNVKTLIDLFKTVTDCETVYITISLPNGEDDAAPPLSKKTFSITQSVLDKVNQKLLILTPSDPDTISDFCEQFKLQKANEKKLSTPSPEVCTESDEQKQRRLEMKKTALETKKLLGQVVADDTVLQSTTIEPSPPVDSTSFSLYQSPLFWAGACTIAALAIAAFYYPHTGHFLELCKNFFKGSESQNIVLPAEPAHIEINIEGNS